jgi:hypothetical protein
MEFSLVFSTIQFILFRLPVFALKMWRIVIIIIIKPPDKTIISLDNGFQVVCRTGNVEYICVEEAIIGQNYGLWRK